jgi:hypothetical protein
MTTLISTPTSMTVRPPSTSVLGSLASSMAPGTWAQVAGTNQNAVLGSQTGASGSMIFYCSYFPWNPVARRIEIVGQDHLYGLPQSYARYDDNLNAFVLAAADDGVISAGSTPAHGYGTTHVNPFTGDLYHHKAPGPTTSIDVWKCASGSATFSRLGTVPSAYAQFAISGCWWKGPFTGVSVGAQGAYMVYNSGASFDTAADGEIVVYDPTVPGFKATLTGVTPFAISVEDCVMAYSEVHNCALYGGGDANKYVAYRLNSNGTHTAMPTVPDSGMGLQSGIIAADPVTGNFLLLAGGGLWELNPTGSGTWTKQTGSRVPPAGVGNPTTMGGGVVLSSISDYGVVAVLTQTRGSGGTFFLYKHA